ncbi:MAG: helix-turn-helix transcriptional regulator [Peptococcaceae bacterium]|nr:helix-turn-helix transcriptional regulator [Peptococcaceae bacterium]
MDNREQKLNYFDYMRLAKEAFQELVAEYPELASLSSRELEIFEQLLTDKTLQMIAEELFISHSAVHFHCKNIYKKLNITSRRQLLLSYIDLCQHTETM